MHETTRYLHSLLDGLAEIEATAEIKNDNNNEQQHDKTT